MLPAGTAEAFVEAPSWEARLPLDDLEPGAPPSPNPNPSPNPDPNPKSRTLALTLTLTLTSIQARRPSCAGCRCSPTATACCASSSSSRRSAPPSPPAAAPVGDRDGVCRWRGVARDRPVCYVSVKTIKK